MPSYRFNTVQTLSSASNLQPAASYTVQAYEPGAQVESVVAGTPTTFNVRAGHGFAAGDKFLLRPGTSNLYSGTDVVASVTATTIVMTSGTYTASAQDYLFNLGSDSTGGSPSFDGDARVTIYSDMGCTQAITNSALTTNSDGEYFYWHNGPRIWELVRSGSTVVAILPDAVVPDDTVRYANHYATGGVGTSADPWTSPSGTGGIQEAIESLPSSGGRVHCPAGVYSFSNSAFLRSYVHLSGDGQGITTLFRSNGTVTNSSTKVNSSIIQAGPTQGTYYSTGSPGYSISILDLTVDGNYTNQTATIDTASHGINFPVAIGGTPTGNVDGIQILNVEIKNTLQSGIYIANARNVLIDGNWIHSVGQISGSMSKNGISMTGNFGGADIPDWCHDVTISNNRIHDAGDATTGTGEGLAFNHWSNVTIVGNDISDVTKAIESTPDSATSLYNWTISANTFHDGFQGSDDTAVAIAIVHGTAGGTYNGVSITSNQIYNWPRDGIYVSRAHGLSISGNSLRDTNTEGTLTYNVAINTIGCSDLSVCGNVVSFVSPAAGLGIRGIQVQGLVPTDTTVRGVICGNVISGVPSDGIGIQVDSDATAILVVGNRVTGANYSLRVGITGTNTDNHFIGNHCTGFNTAEVLNQGGVTNSFQSASHSSVMMVDGSTAPSTEAGYARIYVDTSDGDLKVKFGDGTVRKITDDSAAQTYTVTNHSDDRALNETADTLAQVANVLGTLINDLKTRGVVA